MDTLQYGEIRNDIVALLQAARNASARSVNALMTATYWEIGRRIVESEQRGKQRAEYGETLIKQLAEDLEPRFGGALGGAPYANAGVLLGVAGLEDFADTVVPYLRTIPARRVKSR